MGLYVGQGASLGQGLLGLFVPGSGLWAELEGAAGHEQLPELFCYPAAS